MRVHASALNQERVFMVVQMRVYMDEEAIKMILIGIVLGIGYSQLLDKVL